MTKMKMAQESFRQSEWVISAKVQFQKDQFYCASLTCYRFKLPTLRNYIYKVPNGPNPPNPITNSQMADRQKFCVCIMSLLILLSAAYLGYYLFINPERTMIDKYNHIRFYIFFGQHFLTLAMLLMLLRNNDEHDLVIRWMFQLSSVVVMTFVGGEVFVVARGGRVFGTRVADVGNNNERSYAIAEFQVNEITLYFQIMTDFALFFIVSAVAMIVLKCRDVDSQERYEFMIDNLKSEEYVEEPNAQEKKGCAICLTDLESQRVLKLPCDHVFHKQCLVNWLKRSTVCPMCRNDIQQSLSPTSPQRYPPARSQPILLPPPSPVQNLPVSNPLIQPRQAISLNRRNRVQVGLNQNQRMGNRLAIFEQVERRNEERGVGEIRERNNIVEPVVGRELELDLGRDSIENREQQMRIIRTLRQGSDHMKEPPKLAAITQRINSPSNLIAQNRPPSSHNLRQPSPKTQLHHQQIPQPTLKLENIKEIQNKPVYPNPNENINYEHEKRQVRNFRDVWRNKSELGQMVQ